MFEWTYSFHGISPMLAPTPETTNLEHQVGDLIVRHPHLHQRQVFFRTENGHVVLRGRVRSFFEKQMAQEAIRSLPEIKSIDNQLEVNWQD